ncbi:hypothetical protein SVA_3635 [Sulfurifustis variabilis]|uniref:Peptidase C39-like domain-containing protein n=1 Tax=Sulfurifustis variabilis TaxID=1675686 RepID=A0A1B4VD38_9GAMM|nr:PA2778 family cysteine peptidase [Sulfurifustis variabilis]BAU50171.1 hypothetical protein SVA_3635 [Sulfurifustis variabilis]
MRSGKAARRLPGGLVLFCLWIAGCSTPMTAELVAKRPDLSPRVELDRVPFFPQDAYQCGPAALATVLAAAGVETTAEALVPQVYLPDRRGSLQIELVAAVRRHDRVPYVLAPRLESLLAEVAAGNPVLVLQNLALPWYPKWHYAVVVGYDVDRAEIVLRSGLERRHVVPLGVFERTWRRGNHWAMVALVPDRLPRTAEETSYLQSVAALERLGRNREAERAYRAALARWPLSLAARMGLGNSLYAAGDLEGAERAYREVTEAHPNAGAAFNNLAQTLADQGRFAAAEAAANRAVALGGPLAETFRATLSEIRRRAGNAAAD